LRPGSVDDDTKILFDVERKVLGRLPKHQNIITVFDSGFSKAGDPYLSMELCPSGSLWSLVKSDGPLRADQAVRCGLRIASALALSHRLGIVHRDVKPENVLISDEGEPVLSDFGIAAFLGTNASSSSDGRWSPHHVAPEILRGAEPSASTDLYSLGSTIFAALVGRYPHQSVVGEQLTMDRILARVVDPQWMPVVPESIDAPRELSVLLASLLAKDVRRRMTPADEVVSAFRRIERVLGTETRQLPLAGRTSPAKVIRTAPITVFEPESDVDKTAVAKTSLANTDPAPIATPEPSSRARRRFANQPVSLAAVFLVAAVAVVVTAVALTTRTGRPVRAFTPTSIPGNVPNAQSGLRLSAPSRISFRRLGEQAEVSWLPNADPGAQYEIEVFHDGEIVDSIIVTQPPARLTKLDLAHWLPCVRVNAIDPTTDRYVPSEPVCMNRVAGAGS
jgi:serine/threonine protein kinase